MQCTSKHNPGPTKVVVATMHQPTAAHGSDTRTQPEPHSPSTVLLLLAQPKRILLLVLRREGRNNATTSSEEGLL
ncbi:hypothetical protein Hypma_013279 [Hypsizygus marmoreus]|uniref:Uncharacterized protein n=1 Tax=Hypsizygus marmoreus TaxID=39966 RepID=A0A369JE41_HYPMA|nr:hypothetical protein Hypma_013279 [Hypsizygus marmoreus]